MKQSTGLVAVLILLLSTPPGSVSHGERESHGTVTDLNAELSRYAGSAATRLQAGYGSPEKAFAGKYLHKYTYQAKDEQTNSANLRLQVIKDGGVISADSNGWSSMIFDDKWMEMCTFIADLEFTRLNKVTPIEACEALLEVIKDDESAELFLEYGFDRTSL